MSGSVHTVHFLICLPLRGLPDASLHLQYKTIAEGQNKSITPTTELIKQHTFHN